MEQRIKELTDSGCSQREIAESLNISRDKVRYWQKKLNASPAFHQVTLICEQCDKEYNTTTSSKYSRFCSGKCRNKYRKQTVLEEKECARCKRKFKSHKSIYCSDVCRKPTPKKKVTKPAVKKMCLECGDDFETTLSHKKYCSEECRNRNHLNKISKNRAITAIRYDKRCKECGKHYSTTRSTSSYCSNECNKRCANRRKETTRRKRIAMNGRVDWDISIERLLKRDGHTCYLCGDKVNYKADTNDDNYPSIEHVVPVSKGGTHTWDNVKVAHRGCNTIKSDKLQNENENKNKSDRKLHRQA